MLSPIVVTYLLTYNAVNYDDKNKSEIVLNSLPLKRDEIVIAKYISTFVYAIIGIIYSIVIGLIGKTTVIAMFTRGISLLDIVSTFASICLFCAIFFPVYFKFGAIKARIFNTLLFMVIFFLPMNVINYAIENPNNILVQKFNCFINSTSSFTQNSLALIIGFVFCLISLLISIRVYNNREF